MKRKAKGLEENGHGEDLKMSHFNFAESQRIPLILRLSSDIAFGEEQNLHLRRGDILYHHYKDLKSTSPITPIHLGPSMIS